MTDPNPVAVDPVAAGPGPTAAPDPVPAPPALAEAYPACFDWESPRPLKIDIHRDLMAAGHDRIAVRRALARYCHRPLYRRALRAGAIRVDLHGRPAGAVTAAEVETARAAWNARRAGLPPPRPGAAARPPDGARLPDSTPIPKENLVPGRLELTAKFSELPRPLPVRGGVKIGVPTGEWTVTAILPAAVWRRLEQSAKTYPQWLAALSGSLARFADGEIALQHPTVQVFERKARPEAMAEAKPPEPNASEIEAPEPNASAVKRPEGKASAVRATDRKTPDAPAPVPTFSKLRLKPRSASETG